MTSTLKRLLVDCLIMAGQNHMCREGDAIFRVLHLLISDENDRALCESLYYILLQDEPGFLDASAVLSPEMKARLACFYPQYYR